MNLLEETVSADTREAQDFASRGTDLKEGQIDREVADWRAPRAHGFPIISKYYQQLAVSIRAPTFHVLNCLSRFLFNKKCSSQKPTVDTNELDVNEYKINESG